MTANHSKSVGQSDHTNDARRKGYAAQRFEALVVQLRNCSDVKGRAVGYGYTAALDGLDDTFVDLNATVVRFHFENESFIRSVLDI